MAHFGSDDSFSAARTVQIIGSETNENFTTYTIEMTVGCCSWTVKHRYSEFHELHEKLVASHKVDKGLLPPKKLFGNQSESFVKKRQQDLQLYLQTILNLLALRPPPVLTFFLHFHLYEIHGVTQAMAEDLYNRGEVMLQTDEVYKVTPLQLNALTERLKLPEPTCDSGDVKKDLGHILDFITRTRHLHVCGTSEIVGTSNINMNHLPFDLSPFKSLRTLEVITGNFDMVQGLETIKQTLHYLKVYRTASTIKEVVLQDVPQWKGEDGSQLVGGWDHVTWVDFSHNFIKDIDNSVQILWRVEQLDLSHNQLEGVQHLQWLSHMTHLDLSHNHLHILDALHTKLGNLKCLLLRGNLIESLHGFSKLFSLEILDVSDNKIAKVEDVRPACQLPCLEKLTLTENTVILTVDYRTRILEMFGDRVGEVSLDGEKASQKEKDTVAVRLALQKARDAKPRHAGPRKNSSAASLSDSRGDTPPPTTCDSPLPPTCGATVHSSSALGQVPRTGNSQISSSAPHRPLTHQQSCPDFAQAPLRSSGSVFIPGRSSPGQISTSSHTSGREMVLEGVDLPSPIPEAHPFDPSSDAVPSPPPMKKEYSIASLPSTTSQHFVAWLEQQVLTDDSPSPPPLPASSLDDPGGSQGVHRNQVVSVMWCYAQQYSMQASIFPCCAVLTASKLLLQRLSWSAVKPEGFPGCPELRPCLTLPLNSIQHVVVGPGYAYLRVEEAFVGRGGLFTLLAVEVGVMKRFAEALQDCCTQLDPSNPLDILDLLCQSDLLTEVCHREKRTGLVSDYLAYMLLVRVRDGEEVKACLLVMSENVVYLVDPGCIYWPPATFQSAHEGALHLKVLEELSILHHITDISRNIQLPNNSCGGHNRVDFTPLPLILHIQASEGPRQLVILFSAKSSCEAFVDRLNNLRARHGHVIAAMPAPEGSTSDSVDLADSSFQSCRSECSSVVCNGEGLCPENHVPFAPEVVLTQPTSSLPLLMDQTQVSAGATDPEASQFPEFGVINADFCSTKSPAFSGSDHKQEVERQVSVEAEIHNHSSQSDIQGVDALVPTHGQGESLSGHSEGDCEEESNPADGEGSSSYFADCEEENSANCETKCARDCEGEHLEGNERGSDSKDSEEGTHPTDESCTDSESSVHTQSIEVRAHSKDIKSNEDTKSIKDTQSCEVTMSSGDEQSHVDKRSCEDAQSHGETKSDENTQSHGDTQSHADTKPEEVTSSGRDMACSGATESAAHAAEETSEETINRPALKHLTPCKSEPNPYESFS